MNVGREKNCAKERVVVEVMKGILSETIQRKWNRKLGHRIIINLSINPPNIMCDKSNQTPRSKPSEISTC